MSKKRDMEQKFFIMNIKCFTFKLFKCVTWKIFQVFENIIKSEKTISQV